MECDAIEMQSEIRLRNFEMSNVFYFEFSVRQQHHEPRWISLQLNQSKNAFKDANKRFDVKMKTKHEFDSVKQQFQ